MEAWLNNNMNIMCPGKIERIQIWEEKNEKGPDKHTGGSGTQKYDV